MMKLAIQLLCRTMLMAIFLAACSPAVTPLPPAVPNTEAPTAISQPVETPQPQPVAVATSRGNELEASDPALFKSGAGRPVLVEFFRFT